MPDLPPFPPDPGADGPDADEPDRDRPHEGEPSSADPVTHDDAGPEDPTEDPTEDGGRGAADEREQAAPSGLDDLRQQVITRLGETQQSLLGLVEHFQAEQQRAVEAAEAERGEQRRALEDAERERDEQRRAVEDARREREEQLRTLEDARRELEESERSLREALAQRDELERARDVALRARREAEEALEEERRNLDEAQHQHAAALAAATATAASPPAPAAVEAATAASIAPLRHALASLDTATTQTEVLSRLLEEATALAGRAALLLPGDDLDSLRVWNALGFGEVLEPGATVAPPAAFSRALEGRPLGGEEARWDLDDLAPGQAAVVPLVLRDRTRALLYADRTDDRQPFDRDALQILTFCAAQALEILPLRSVRPAGTLLDATPEVLAAPAAAEMAETVAAEPEEAEEEGEARDSGEEAASGEATLDASADEWALAETIDEDLGERVEAEPSPEATGEEPEAAIPWALEDAEAGSSAAAVEGSAQDAGEAAGEADAWELAEEPPLEAAAESAEAEEPETVAGDEEPQRPGFAGLRAVPPPLPAPADPAATPLPPPPPTFPRAVPTGEREEASDSGSAAAPPAQEAPADEETEAGEAPDADEFRTQAIRLDQISSRPGPPPETASPRSAEVVPPSDVRGPGWAFTGEAFTSDASDEPLHEEARRLARLLVSEIKLYNEEQIEEGRRQGNIYRVLKEPIDRSRLLYEERIDQRVRAETDYYQDELVRSLAEGDRGLLGV